MSVIEESGRRTVKREKKVERCGMNAGYSISPSIRISHLGSRCSATISSSRRVSKGLWY